MDEVQQNRARADLPTPWHIEIFIGLHQPEETMDGDDLAEPPLLNESLGALNHRIVAPVMACEDRNSRPFSRFDHLQATRDIFSARLFDQRRYSAGIGFN